MAINRPLENTLIADTFLSGDLDNCAVKRIELAKRFDKLDPEARSKLQKQLETVQELIISNQENQIEKLDEADICSAILGNSEASSSKPGLIKGLFGKITGVKSADLVNQIQTIRKLIKEKLAANSKKEVADQKMQGSEEPRIALAARIAKESNEIKRSLDPEIGIPKFISSIDDLNKKFEVLHKDWKNDTNSRTDFFEALDRFNAEYLQLDWLVKIPNELKQQYDAAIEVPKYFELKLKQYDALRKNGTKEINVKEVLQGDLLGKLWTLKKEKIIDSKQFEKISKDIDKIVGEQSGSDHLESVEQEVLGIWFQTYFPKVKQSLIELNHHLSAQDKILDARLERIKSAISENESTKKAKIALETEAAAKIELAKKEKAAAAKEVALKDICRTIEELKVNPSPSSLKIKLNGIKYKLLAEESYAKFCDQLDLLKQITEENTLDGKNRLINELIGLTYDASDEVVIQQELIKPTETYLNQPVDQIVRDVLGYFKSKYEKKCTRITHELNEFRTKLQEAYQPKEVVLPPVKQEVIVEIQQPEEVALPLAKQKVIVENQHLKPLEFELIEEYRSEVNIAPLKVEQSNANSALLLPIPRSSKQYLHTVRAVGQALEEAGEDPFRTRFALISFAKIYKEMKKASPEVQLGFKNFIEEVYMNFYMLMSASKLALPANADIATIKNIFLGQENIKGATNVSLNKYRVQAIRISLQNK